MSTVCGLRRKGFSQDGINNFCNDIGITTRNSVIPIEKLEQFVRIDLDKTSRRIFSVFDPIKVTLKNFDSATNVQITCPNVPNLPNLGEHVVPFTGVFYIEKSDFKEKDENDYFGLAYDNKEKVVRLKYTNYNIRLVEIVKNPQGEVTDLVVEHCADLSSKHAIHWVPIVNGEEPIHVEIREYDRLFLSENPIEKYGADWLKDINPNSLTILQAIIDPSVKDLKAYSRIQIERHGFYVVDPDTTTEKFVLNKTLNLKESKWKASQTNK
jgi:glutaminyl-tRNA synthetase